MDTFNLLDQVQLTAAIPLSSDMGNALKPPEAAPVGTSGTIVEVLESGEAFLVELFGDWVRLQETVGLVRAEAEAPGAFRETLGVEVVSADQIQLVAHSNAVKLDLYRLLDDMPEALLAEVQTFAEFLQHKQQQTADSATQTPSSR
ncbi:MAG: DUF2281 domain-containing protein [Cyanobacteria bacterium P01_D01_bin.6]